MRKLLVLTQLILCPVAFGQTVELPKEVKAEPGLIVVPAKTDCATLQWLALDPGLQVIPADLLKDSKTACAVALVKGKYRLLAYGARGDKASPPAITLVIIGEPTPPVPPDPPGPVDPLLAKLQAAYQQTPDAAKLAKYREVLAAAGNVIDSAQTAGQLVDSLRATADSVIGKGSLEPLRRAIGDYWNTVLPQADVALTAELRAVIKREFTKVGDLLGKVK